MKRVISLLIAGVLVLTGCSNSSPAGLETTAKTDGTITIGSANFPESEIIAEMYAQILEAKGFKVDRKMQIGAREVFIKALLDGSTDINPEYSGNLLQYFNKDSLAASSDDVYADLVKALPDTLRVAKPAAAQNKDAFQVTKEFSEKHGVKSLADLAKRPGKIRLGGAPELAYRPYGPKGLAATYGVALDKIEFVPLSDKGGPLTSQALKNGDVDVADIFSTTPAIAENGFVTLEDPKNLVVAQNVVPLISTRIKDPKVDEALNSVSAALTSEELVKLNILNRGEKKMAPAAVAKQWLEEHKLI